MVLEAALGKGMRLTEGPQVWCKTFEHRGGWQSITLKGTDLVLEVHGPVLLVIEPLEKGFGLGD